MQLPSFFLQIDQLAGEDEPSSSVPSIDHNADELPFSALSGRRFEILGFLLEIDDATESDIVTLVQASGDKGRDILVHRDGTLIRVIQCKNQLKKVGTLALLEELVKLVLFDEVGSFLPSTKLRYELWAPRGFTEKADTLIAEWPNRLEDAEVLKAFQVVTSTFKTLEDFRWETIGAKLVARLKDQFDLGRQEGISLSRRIRANVSVYQRFFQAVLVLPQEYVDSYLDQKLVPRVVGLVRMAAEESHQYPASLIDKAIDEAASFINSNRCSAAESRLKGLEELHGGELSDRQRYRVKANLGLVALRLGKTQEAAGCFLDAATIGTESERSSADEALAHLLLGDRQRAFGLSDERRTRYPSSGRLLSIWISSSPEGSSLEDLERAVPEDLREDPEVNAALCQRFLVRGFFESARACALRAQAKAPDWPEGFLLGAKCSMAFVLLPPATQTPRPTVR